MTTGALELANRVATILSTDVSGTGGHASVLLVGSAVTNPTPRDLDIVLVVGAGRSRDDVAEIARREFGTAGPPVSVHGFHQSELAEVASCDGFRVVEYQSASVVLHGVDPFRELRPRLDLETALTSLAIQVVYWTVLAATRGYSVSLSHQKILERARRNARLLSSDDLRVSAIDLWMSLHRDARHGPFIRDIVGRPTKDVADHLDALLAAAPYEDFYRGDRYRDALRIGAVSELSERIPWTWRMLHSGHRLSGL